MSAKLQEQLKQKTDRELLEMQTYSKLNSEKHLDRISKNLQFFFWLALIGIIYFIWALLTTANTVMNSNPY